MEIPPCVLPIPRSPSNCIPSTNISSPIAKGWGSIKPLNGVSRKQVTTPELLDCIELIPTPFELLIEIIWWFMESNPDTGAKILTLDIVWLGAIATNDESSTIVFVTGLKISKSGALIKSTPPLTISTDFTTSRLSISRTGATWASGLNVLSEEYS